MTDLQPSALATLKSLRARLVHLERDGTPVRSERVSTGSPSMDAALSKGLPRDKLHEIFAQSMADEPAAAAFAVALALRASKGRPIVWVRQDFVGLEMGEIYPPGLAELGLSPDRLILVRARDGPGVLRAGEEAARCSSLGAVLIEPWGNPKTLDLVATRRLTLAAARSNLPVFMVRAGGAPAASAAETRWSITNAPSRSFEADAPGHPCFVAELLKDRAGAAGRRWTVEWNRDRLAFSDIAADSAGNDATLSRNLVPVIAGGPDHARHGGRRAG